MQRIANPSGGVSHTRIDLVVPPRSSHPDPMKAARQVAALPVRRDVNGDLQVLLVTSRETRRWVIPKGWPWPDLADHLAAAEEAREEAGVRGRPRKRAIGSYAYDKRLKDGAKPVHVDIYLLIVTRELDTWPERRERTRAWFTPEAAADAVSEPDLQELLRNSLETIAPAFDKAIASEAAKKKKSKKAKNAKTAKQVGKKVGKKSAKTTKVAKSKGGTDRVSKDREPG